MLCSSVYACMYMCMNLCMHVHTCACCRRTDVYVSAHFLGNYTGGIPSLMCFHISILSLCAQQCAHLMLNVESALRDDAAAERGTYVLLSTDANFPTLSSTIVHVTSIIVSEWRAGGRGGRVCNTSLHTYYAV